PDIDQQRSLRNLQFPLDWEAIVRYTGLPAVLKPNTGGGWKDVFIVNSIEELITAYDQTGLKTMILQEFIDWDDYVRCICVGREHVLPSRGSPEAAGHGRGQITTPAEGRLRGQAIKAARSLVAALGYDMHSVASAGRGDVLYAIDFLNPAPDFDNFSIKEDNFRWVIDHMSDLVLRYARGEATPPWRDEHRWWSYVRKTPSPDPVQA